MKIISWLLTITIVSLIASALFHSCKYHNHYDDGNSIKIAYRGIEQFWHKHDNEYRISIKQLCDYKKMSKDKVYAEVESRGFTESESAGAQEEDGYFKWRYKSNNTDLSKYEIAYGKQQDTTLIIYTVPEKEYVTDLMKQLTGTGFIQSKIDTVGVYVMHFFNNEELDLKVFCVESTRDNDKPSQFVLAKKEEFKAIMQEVNEMK